MDDVNHILQKVKVPTHCLKSLSLQEVLTAATKYGRSAEENQESWSEVVQTLWTHLQTGFVSFDNQLLCATCFYSVLSLSGKQDLYLSVILDIIREGIVLTEKGTKNLEISHTVSLMYGMFQSSFLSSNMQVSHVTILLNAIFNLQTLLAYEYSRYTFIVFKTISSFKKVIDTDLQECLFNKENTIKLLNIVNHNWENPITGVRDLNKDIFRTLVSIMNNEMLIKVVKEINKFHWNKAKYLMIAEIVKQYTGDINDILKDNDWLNGLFHSLNKPGLVSAGTDMYNAIFRKIKTKNEWSNIFLEPVVNILNKGPKKAIENFSNYWCLSTLKGFPTLTAKLIEELQCLDDSELKLYSSLCVMKQANKLGFINKNWEMKENYVEKTVIDGMQHCENAIRTISFEILCITNSKAMPTKSEYGLVLDYIINNINSDCTVLRLNMLNNISSFLTQLHINYLNYIKKNETYDVENLKTFCFEFQDFIITNIKITGNYQRKITCVKIAQIFLNDLGEVPLKRQKQTRIHDSIIHALEKGGHWVLSDKDVILNIILLLKDPADDVRENVIRLLFNNYSVKLSKKNMMDLLVNEGLKCLSSKFFYEISCGQSIFKLIVNLLLEKEQLDSTFKSVDDVFAFAFKELIKEYNMHRDIVRSIRSGKQLHSFINILYVVLDVCHQNKHAIKITDKHLLQLLNILEGTSNQFAWEQQTTTSTDFSEISDMVNSIIASSEIKLTDDWDDQTKISGLHQLVLNCLWLNVKASCDLASLLIKCQNDDSQIEISRKALDLMGHVLETCRHKGAIEATGAALGQSIRHLTSLPEETQLSKLPMLFLIKKLDELISEATIMASVTRRGAGLSIMVHRIVSNDVKRGKPLFHYFMTKILKACNEKLTPLSDASASKKIDNEKDLPKAVYIHFLTRIVTDSSLSSDIMFYSTDLAELAFGNLTSCYWQIRNAALQLYGALIQKLIGQKKASGSNEETIATVACDELRTHTPKLWHYVQSQLKNTHDDERLQHHSNLVPILNMLASLAQRYNFSYDLLNQKEADTEMMKHLLLLLDSPIYTVRRLTAKSISNMYPFEEIYEDLIKQDHPSENNLHGSLMLISNYNTLYNLESADKYKNEYENLKLKFNNIFKHINKHSYICKEEFDSMFYYPEPSSKNLKKIFRELDSNCQDIGVQHWANKRIEKYVQQVTWDLVPKVMKIILKRSDFQIYCERILDKIKKSIIISQETVVDLSKTLLLFENKFESGVVWMILYQIILKIEKAHLLLEIFDLSEIVKQVKCLQVPYKMRFIIPYAARIAAVRHEEGYLLEISKIVKQFTDPSIADVDMRYIAAMANNELGSEINKFTGPVKLAAIKSAVILLQDEDEDVRILSTEFYSKMCLGLNVSDSQKSCQPYVCLRKILDRPFLLNILTETGISALSNDLNKCVTKMSRLKNDEDLNPFANDSTNIYLEIHFFKQLIDDLK